MKNLTFYESIFVQKGLTLGNIIMTGVTNAEAGRDNIGDFINLYVRNY